MIARHGNSGCWSRNSAGSRRAASEMISKGAHHRIKEKPFVSEPLKREACDKILRKLPVVTDVV
jgi:hypothetical protein